MGADVFHGDGRTDMTKLIVAFCNLKNAPQRAQGCTSAVHHFCRVTSFREEYGGSILLRNVDTHVQDYTVSYSTALQYEFWTPWTTQMSYTVVLTPQVCHDMMTYRGEGNSRRFERSLCLCLQSEAIQEWPLGPLDTASHMDLDLQLHRCVNLNVVLYDYLRTPLIWRSFVYLQLSNIWRHFLTKPLPLFYSTRVLKSR